jgi:FlaA1/EpsC-like NDP-sugar epimerase
VANVLGALNVARAAGEAGTEVLAYSSTDKAVYPPSVYGATKRIVELTLRAFARELGRPRCNLVRLVNAVGAQGGVIRIFARQILAGQPLTVTDEAMTRYWISIEEAALLVAQAACLEPEIDLIVPDVGPPSRLTAVAQSLQQILCPQAPLSFVITGMRPGERLHELLFREDERLEPCAHPGVLRVRDFAGERCRMADVLTAVARFEAFAAEGDEEGLRRALFAFVEN